MAQIWPASPLIDEAVAAGLFPAGTYAWAPCLGTDHDAPHITVWGAWGATPCQCMQTLTFALAQWRAFESLPSLAGALPWLTAQLAQSGRSLADLIVVWAHQQWERELAGLICGPGSLLFRSRRPSEEVVNAARAILIEHDAATRPAPGASGSCPASVSPSPTVDR